MRFFSIAALILTCFSIVASVGHAEPRAEDGGPAAPPAAPAAAPDADGRTLIDENHKIGADSMSGTGIRVATAGRFRIKVEGVANYGKGFTVRILPGKVWRDFRAGKATKKALDDYPHEHTGRYGRTLPFEAGEWFVVTHNSENFLKSLTVHVVVRKAQDKEK